ncbi:MAG: gfo/Idh/MocA family oxidoreductase, partial [Phycisphaeraceae bacterium]
MSNQIRFTRRRFIQTAAVTSAWAMSAGSYSNVFGANDRLNIAFIGTGGIANGQHLNQLSGDGLGCPAYCDADAGRFGKVSKMHPNAAGFTDYRKMYDKHMKDIDAVSVA